MSTDQPLVSALIVGARKTGTTWIYENFKLSRSIIVPTAVKETGFFLTDSYLTREDYNGLFDTDGIKESYLVEVDTSLLNSRDAPSNIQQYNPQMKIIVISRDPLEFAPSRFIQGSRKGLFVHNTLVDELNANKDFRNELRFNAHLDRYRDYFAPEQILIVEYAFLRSDPEAFYNKVFYFITGKMSTHDVNFEVVNKAREARFANVFILGVSLGRWLRRRRMFLITNVLRKIARTVIFQKGSEGLVLSKSEELFILNIVNSELED